MHDGAPERKKTAFVCPHCSAFAQQSWHNWYEQMPIPMYAGSRPPESVVNDANISMAVCAACSRPTVWKDDLLLYPLTGSAPAPTEDMPDRVRHLYQEADGVLSHSPRAAAALLRLAIQELCIALGEKGKNINEDIKALVADGLPQRVQRALDLVRVTGNEAVHPSKIIDTDDQQVVGTLFRLINVIVEDRITKNKMIDDLYESLPENKRNEIDIRDGRRSS